MESSEINKDMKIYTTIEGITTDPLPIPINVDIDTKNNKQINVSPGTLGTEEDVQRIPINLTLQIFGVKPNYDQNKVEYNYYERFWSRCRNCRSKCSECTKQKLVTIKSNENKIVYEYNYCEKFWSGCSNCFCKTTGCCLFYFTNIFYNLLCSLNCIVTLIPGFCEGACSAPFSCADKYESGKWNYNSNKKICIDVSVIFNDNDPLELWCIYCKAYANIHRNIGSLVHPYRISECLCPQKQEMK
jgi:hypothetical protein